MRGLHGLYVVLLALMVMFMAMPAIACDDCRGAPGISAALDMVFAPVMAATQQIESMTYDVPANKSMTPLVYADQPTCLTEPMDQRARHVISGSKAIAESSTLRPNGDGRLLLRQGGRSES